MLTRTLSLIVLGSVLGCSSHHDANAPTAASPAATPDQMPTAATAPMGPAVTATPPAPVPVVPVRAKRAAAPVRMVRVRVANGEVQAIQPLKWVDYQLELPSAKCTVSARIEGLAGGNKDFDAFLLDDDNFKIFTNDIDPTRGETSGRTQKWQFTHTVGQPGRWHLVVSNRFSEISKKVVKVWAYHTCPAKTRM